MRWRPAPSASVIQLSRPDGHNSEITSSGKVSPPAEMPRICRNWLIGNENAVAVMKRATDRVRRKLARKPAATRRQDQEQPTERTSVIAPGAVPASRVRRDCDRGCRHQRNTTARDPPPEPGCAEDRVSRIGANRGHRSRFRRSPRAAHKASDCGSTMMVTITAATMSLPKARDHSGGPVQKTGMNGAPGGQTGQWCPGMAGFLAESSARGRGKRVWPRRPRKAAGDVTLFLRMGQGGWARAGRVLQPVDRAPSAIGRPSLSDRHLAGRAMLTLQPME